MGTLIVSNGRISVGQVGYMSAFPDKVDFKDLQVRELNIAVGTMLMDLGFVPYKCPGILYEEVFRRLDPGFVDLLGRLRRAVAPHAILNPDRWRKPDGPAVP